MKSGLVISVLSAVMLSSCAGQYNSVKLEKMTSPITGSWGDQGNGTYRNPVLNANYPDCDIEAYGNKWYMISSKGKSMKGMTLLESEDLVNWTVAGGIVDKITWKTSTGVWAGDLAYHAGRWYCYFIDFEKGLFLCTANDVKGPWSSPVLLLEKKGMTDPAVFWDYDSNQAYLICNYQIDKTEGKEAGRYHQRLFRLSWDGMSLADDGTEVYVEDGAEAAKIYKIDGRFYIFISEWIMDENGRKLDRRQIALRSDSIYGPYEKKILLEKGNGTDRSCCQGSLVQAPDSSWWYMHQLVQGDNTYEGRPLCLIPVFWQDGWPLLGIDTDGNGIGNTVWEYRKPVPGKCVSAPSTDDDFNSRELSPQWQWSSNPVPDKLSLSEHPGFLRLYSSVPGNKKRQFHTLPSMILQRKMGKGNDTVTVKVSLEGLVAGQSAGLLFLGHNYSAVGVEYKDDKIRICHRTDCSADFSEPLSGESVLLRICLEENTGQAYYSLDGNIYTSVGKSFELRTKGFVGLSAGIYSMHPEGKGFADFDWFSYKYDGPKSIALNTDI